MNERITIERLEELRRAVGHATMELVGITSDGSAPEVMEDIQAYFHHYAAPQRDAEGNLRKDLPCIVCDEPLVGLLASLLGRGGFEWGIVHGRGHCRNCGWPASGHHYIKDPCLSG